MNKKGVTMEFLVGMAFVIFSFVAITSVLLVAKTKAAQVGDELTCRNSVLFREDISKKVLGKTIGFPLLCSTKDIVIKGKGDEVTKEIATRMDMCWFQYVQGQIRDPFKEGSAGARHNCAVCYTLSFKDKDYEIDEQALMNYLNKETYKFEGDQKITHLDYIQSFGDGKGNVFITNVNAPEVYAVAYGAPTLDCGKWCAVTGGLGFAGGAGVAALGCSFIPVAGTITCGTVAAVAGLASAWFASSETADLVETIENREVHTIYLAPLSEVSKICDVIE